MNIDNATLAQYLAIETDHRNVQVVAGPGSGKSSTLIARIERILRAGADPKKLAVLSFTNAAANELRRRLPLVNVLPMSAVKGKHLGETVELGFLGTLHSFALRMLKEHGAPFGYGIRTAIIAPDSAADLMASKASTLSCKTSLERLLKAKAKDGRPPRGQRLTLDQTVIATYLDELREAGVVDYDVLLHEFRDMLTSGDPNAMSASQSLDGEFSHLFVDEVQDSAEVDWAIYRALPIANKFYVGDPDQNLYEFRGAAVREMIREATAPTTLEIKLQENFRSSSEICDAAQRLIENNKARVDKRTISVKGPGGLVKLLGEFESEGEEIAVVARKIKEIQDFIKGGSGLFEMAVISRTNAIADGFRKTLPAMGIPIVETKRHTLPPDWAFARSTIEIAINPENDSLAYFYLVAYNLRDGLSPVAARKAAQQWRVAANAAGKTINEVYLKLSPITIPESALCVLVSAGVSRESQMIAAEKYRELPPGATMDEFALSLASVTEYSKEEPGEGVHVLTIHGSKGKEFDVVFLVGMEDETIPGQSAAKGDDAIEGERRCAYVAMTRARASLFLSSVKTRVTAWKQVVSRKPSRFLKEIFP
jgi:DNA helicase II / ATP-dependent DNA helicase PcrA